MRHAPSRSGGDVQGPLLVVARARVPLRRRCRPGPASGPTRWGPGRRAPSAPARPGPPRPRRRRRVGRWRGRRGAAPSRAPGPRQERLLGDRHRPQTPRHADLARHRTAGLLGPRRHPPGPGLGAIGRPCHPGVPHPQQRDPTGSEPVPLRIQLDQQLRQRRVGQVARAQPRQRIRAPNASTPGHAPPPSRREAAPRRSGGHRSCVRVYPLLPINSNPHVTEESVGGRTTRARQHRAPGKVRTTRRGGRGGSGALSQGGSEFRASMRRQSSSAGTSR